MHPSETFTGEVAQLICKRAQTQIEQIKDFWKNHNSPAFIRIEGGVDRPTFIAQLAFGLPLSDKLSPQEQIEMLVQVEGDEKEEMLDTFRKLLPGNALIFVDTDGYVVDGMRNSGMKMWFTT